MIINILDIEKLNGNIMKFLFTKVPIDNLGSCERFLETKVDCIINILLPFGKKTVYLLHRHDFYNRSAIMEEI